MIGESDPNQGALLRIQVTTQHADQSTAELPEQLGIKSFMMELAQVL